MSTHRKRSGLSMTTNIESGVMPMAMTGRGGATSVGSIATLIMPERGIDVRNPAMMVVTKWGNHLLIEWLWWGRHSRIANTNCSAGYAEVPCYSTLNDYPSIMTVHHRYFPQLDDYERFF
ncbi:hypothetical protein BHYA_0321g00040 [Botrytis hyacinthi]|uniref:Uncharacterized protein n=1 Tax=Botrytis hyacinthi TaxID=278943 RepID=A0A4Z1GER9_9HELO|nr:hypothetical protein BHYA_0321g00040 [Botrytis hyacinthi]